MLLSTGFNDFIFVSELSLEKLYSISSTIRKLSDTVKADSRSRYYVLLSTLIYILVNQLPGLENIIVLSEDVVEETEIFCLCNSNAREGVIVPLAVRKLSPAASSLWIWGHCIEMLWEVVMLTADGPSLMASSWEALTPRLLIWNGLVGGSISGEWARRETIRELHRRSETLSDEDDIDLS